MKKNTISVAISVKEYSAITIEVINSFQRQTLLPSDIVVVGEQVVLEKLKKKIKRSTLISYYNFFGDKNEARNTAILKTKGDYVIFCDHDMVAASNLLEECSKLLGKYNALNVLEVGEKSRKLFKRIFKLEKEIVQTDSDALTPRVFKKNLFDFGEKPFDKKFGVLDEWGFFTKLKNKNPKISLVRNSHFKVKDEFSIFERIARSYKKGHSFKSLLEENKIGAKRRVNPFRRGIIVYSKNINVLLKDPLAGVMLICIKSIELIAFLVGLLSSTYLIEKNGAYEKNL